MIHLDHRDSRPLYEQIVDNIRRQIRNGILGSGDKLPSVRELSAQLTINPNPPPARAALSVPSTVPGRKSF